MRSRKQIPDIDQENTNKWMTRAKFSSHIEGYIYVQYRKRKYLQGLWKENVSIVQ